MRAEPTRRDLRDAACLAAPPSAPFACVASSDSVQLRSLPDTRSLALPVAVGARKQATAAAADAPSRGRR